MTEAKGGENLGLRLACSPGAGQVGQQGCNRSTRTAEPCRHFLSSQRTMAQKQVQPSTFPPPGP